MSKQTIIEFLGLCTHFDRKRDPGVTLPVAHRVVLPYRPDEVAWMGKRIKPHLPKIILPEGTTFDPLKTTLVLRGGTEPLTTDYNCIPAMRSIWPSMQASENVVIGRPTRPGAVYFDFEEGALTSFLYKGSRAMRLTIETDQERTLTRTKWADGTVDDYTLPAGSTTTVCNLTDDGSSDQLYDFILHFAVGAQFPPPQTDEFAQVLEMKLKEPAICWPEHHDPRDIGPGCSNSTFP